MAPKAEKKPAEKKPAAEKAPAAEKSPAEKKPKAGKKLPKEGAAAAGDKKKKRTKKHGDVQDLHLQGAEAGGVAARTVQQEADDYFPRDPDRREAGVAGELAKHAVSEGTKAVTKFTSS
ncbi:Histone H2B [Sesamum angolense]|uniref:Histone H2B n=1 Tax=Sesamum angolense TaxID=2727404 RepID=A0AAE2BZZ6_9LAMI|nr:Histone H2B [Sesamum angolense]